MQTIDRILTTAGETFFIPIFPWIRIITKMRNFTAYNSLAFFRENFQEVQYRILNQDGIRQGLNSEK